METEVWEEEKGVRVRNSELWFEERRHERGFKNKAGHSAG